MFKNIPLNLSDEDLQLKQDSGKTRKGEQTRTRILETALRLFREQGYEKTTMRAIAAEGGVSLGSAYYYFESKEHLVQAFYLQTHLEHLAACQGILQEYEDLADRLLGVVRAKIETGRPYPWSAKTRSNLILPGNFRLERFTLLGWTSCS